MHLLKMSSLMAVADGFVDDVDLVVDLVVGGAVAAVNAIGDDNEVNASDVAR